MTGISNDKSTCVRPYKCLEKLGNIVGYLCWSPFEDRSRLRRLAKKYVLGEAFDKNIIPIARWSTVSFHLRLLWDPIHAFRTISQTFWPTKPDKRAHHSDLKFHILSQFEPFLYLDFRTNQPFGRVPSKTFYKFSSPVLIIP